MTFQKWKQINSEVLERNYSCTPVSVRGSFNEFCSEEYWANCIPSSRQREDLMEDANKWY